MSRHINEKGLSKLKLWEGLRLKAYDDGTGTLTIGYGHTSASGMPMVHPGMTVTTAQAEDIFQHDLAVYEKNVERLVNVPLTDNQFAALVSFDFNTGGLAQSTLLKKLNAGDYASVPHEMMKWVKGTDPKTKKKVIIEGLVNRRAGEVGLWASGAEVASSNAEAEKVTPPVVTKETVTWGAGVLATMGTLFDGNGAVQWVLAGVIGVSFTVGLIMFLSKRMKQV